MAVQWLIGGSDKTNGDESELRRLAVSKQDSEGWGCPKNTRKGDRLLIYIIRPTSAITASAVALRDASHGDSWRYETDIGQIRMLQKPIELSEARKMFPKWRWLNAPQAYCYLTDKQGEKLWNRAHGKSRGNQSTTKLAPAPTPSASSQLVSTSLISQGAGFGDAKTNRLVEQAAIKFATQHLQQQGFTVVSHEKRGCGYDLEATKGRKVRHIEVKGISGGEQKFVITPGEKHCAGSDPLFELFVVNSARDKSRTLACYTAKEFLSLFAFNPIAYMANKK